MRPLLAMIAVLLCLSAFTLSANAARCTEMTVRGTYAFHEEGQWLDNTAAPHVGGSKLYVVGNITFGPRGIGHYTENTWYYDSASTSNAVDLPIYYSIQPDCSIGWMDPADGSFYSGFVGNRGKQMFWIRDGVDLGLRGEAVKQQE